MKTIASSFSEYLKINKKSIIIFNTTLLIMFFIIWLSTTIYDSLSFIITFLALEIGYLSGRYIIFDIKKDK